MRIYIPTRSRADTFLRPFHTVKQLRGVVVPVVVCPRNQLKEYRQALEDHDMTDAVKLLTTGVQGIAKTRQYCAKDAQKAGADYFFMMDDDIRFYKRKPKVTNLGNVEKGPQVKSMIAAVERQFKKGHAAVGISAREGNNHIKTDTNVNTRLMRAWGVRVEDFLKCTHGRVDVMEDFDVQLQLLRKGLTNVCLFNFAQGQAQTQSPGGCSDYRTHELHERSANKLAALHDGFVSTRTKHNKSGGEFGTRTEVTIQWKKAYASSQG